MTDKEIGLYLTILMLYGQQKYMYDNKVHSVEHRIVSITQPWIRPVVRGKARAAVEFGAKFDLSLDSEGYGHIEKISFEAYNESTCLIEAVERFKARTGHYPEVYWQTRSTVQGQTGTIAKTMVSAYPVRSLAGRA